MDIQAVIQKAAKVLCQESPAGSEVILFGSHARGQADEQSDVDLLVVEPEVRDRFRETNRLCEKLKWMRVPFDLIVLSRESFEGWRNVPNTLPYEASREGRVLRDLT